MPSQTTQAHLVLPPPFKAHFAGPGDILDLAEAKADLGAGTLVWRLDRGVLALAVVLEPGPPLVRTAPEAELGYLAGLAALCEMIAQHAQPERPITLHWPDRVIYDAALLAGARWRTGPLGADGLPEWVIFAAEIIADRPDLDEAGRYPGTTSLVEEDFPEVPQLLESFAAHLKLVIDRWSVTGPETVLRAVLNRVADRDALKGAAIVEGQLQLPPLASCLSETEWRDPARMGPRW